MNLILLWLLILHLSPIDGERLLSRIVDKIEFLNPDIIFYAGDIVDDKAASS